MEEVWDALTDPERIGRWFLPISGDYRLGGRYQFEGNAGGEILECERPRRLRVSWVYGEVSSPADVSEVELRLTSVAGRRPRPSSSSTSRSCRTSSGPRTDRVRSASDGRADCSVSRCTCTAVPWSDPIAWQVLRRRPGLQHPEQPGVGRRVPGRWRGSGGRRDDGREHDPVLRTGSGDAVLRRAGHRTDRLVEMGESRTPRPEPFLGDHYERVRWFVVDRPDGHRHSAGRSSHVPLDRA